MLKFVLDKYTRNGITLSTMLLKHELNRGDDSTFVELLPPGSEWKYKEYLNWKS